MSNHLWQVKQTFQWQCSHWATLPSFHVSTSNAISCSSISLPWPTVDLLSSPIALADTRLCQSYHTVARFVAEQLEMAVEVAWVSASRQAWLKRGRPSNASALLLSGTFFINWRKNRNKSHLSEVVVRTRWARIDWVVAKEVKQRSNLFGWAFMPYNNNECCKTEVLFTFYKINKSNMDK